MMPPIDPHGLSAMPAPYWFVQFFKALGFTLHMVPMNLWYAGLLLAMVLHLCGSEHGRRFSGRLMTQMPVLVALGINFGIVPLLFVQVAYYKAFYSATILTAWFWLAIVGLLIPAYYGVYAYALGLRNEQAGLASWRKAAGWGAAMLFILIGFLFANGWSLMTNVGAWSRLWENHSVGGATLGTALNVADRTFWPRWLLMFGLALMTTAAWLVVDAAWFARKENETYRQWASSFAWKLHTAGAIWFAAAGSWYVFGAWQAGLRASMSTGWLHVLMIATALAPGLPWILMALGRKQAPRRATALGIALAQLGVLAVNATSRQVVQNLELKAYLDVAAIREEVQVSPLILFLAVFVAGLGVIGWVIAQAVKASATEPGQSGV
ncbi:MAG: hypothetical protein JXB62_13905 [Pirellulales bacterium]|nr:hypothetical protein [Pirellulales bacterium]